MTFTPNPGTLAAAVPVSPPDWIAMSDEEILVSGLQAVNEIRAVLALAALDAMPLGGHASTENSLSAALEGRVRSYTTVGGGAFLITSDLPVGIAVETCGYAGRHPKTEFVMESGGRMWLDLVLRPPLSVFLWRFMHDAYPQLVLVPEQRVEA